MVVVEVSAIKCSGYWNRLWKIPERIIQFLIFWKGRPAISQVFNGDQHFFTEGFHRFKYIATKLRGSRFDFL